MQCLPLIVNNCTFLNLTQLIMFRNERYTEVPSEHLKYFLLPVLLGDLTARDTDNLLKFIVSTWFYQ